MLDLLFWVVAFTMTEAPTPLAENATLLPA